MEMLIKWELSFSRRAICNQILLSKRMDFPLLETRVKNISLLSLKLGLVQSDAADQRQKLLPQVSFIFLRSSDGIIKSNLSNLKALGHSK